jgi:hypothetical protein
VNLLARIAVLVSCFVIAARAEGTGEPAVRTTGSRPWKMADGSMQRLRFVKSENQRLLFQGKIGAAAYMDVRLFAPEEQAAIRAFETGAVKLVATPGLGVHPDFPAGKVSEEQRKTGYYWLGETRTWQHANGKKVEARLINLNDDRVSLLAGNTVANLSPAQLAAEDLAYLERIKAGTARMYPDLVTIGGMGWGGTNHAYQAAVSGERYAAAAAGGNFEEALATCVREISGKLDREQWTLLSFTEEAAPAPVSGPRSYHSIPADPSVETRPRMYRAVFRIKKGGLRKAEQLWEPAMSPRDGSSGRELYLYALADGELVKTEKEDGY